MTPPRRPAPRRGHWRGVAAATLACVAVIAGAALWLGQASSHARGTAPARVQPARAAEERPCPPAAKSVVLLVLGQSNAGNHGTGRGASTRGVVWHAGRCYAIADPLAGATGDGGSVWSRLADDLASPNLVLVVFAVDATRISDWTAGSVGAHLDALIDDVRRHGIAVSAVLWGQGEADARASVTRDDYARELESLVRRLRERGIGAPILVARSTRCRNTGSAAVRDAVALVAANTPGVVAGPDLDALDEATRADGCHFNAAGLQRAALLWRDALRAARVPQAAP